MRTIKYQIRDWVKGSPTYVPLDISTEDRSYLIEAMIQWMLHMGELDAIDADTDLGYARERWWHKRNKTLWGMNKSYSKPNSACGFISGLLNNMMFNGQTHITELQKEKIEHVSLIMSNINTHFETIRFQIGLTYE